MKPVIDLTKEYGIVLEGGGAKGAYQIGAWKALEEAGVKIKGIAGTSVGALNGALMCMGDYDNAQAVWENISYSKVMDVDDEVMGKFFGGELSFREAFELTSQAMKDGGVDVTPLRELIATHMDAKKIYESPIDLYILTFCMDELQEMDIDVKELPAEDIPDLLLASAYIFPLFKNEKIHGKMFIDGGAINNVPLSSLVERGYEDIIVIRIYGIGREKKVKIPEETKVYKIAPRVNLGNIIDFNARKSCANLRIGYYDTMRMIYGLSGSIYYIDEDCTQQEALERLCCFYTGDSLRKFVEITLPGVAHELKLGPRWTYKELYLGVLEAAAKVCKVPKYRIYALDELENIILERKHRLEEYKKSPAFARLILSQYEEEEDEPERT